MGLIRDIWIQQQMDDLTDRVRLRDRMRPAPLKPFTRGRTVWYDGADLATFTLAGDDIVDWTNKASGALAVPPVGNRPQVNQDTLNGMNTVTFVGGDNTTGTWLVETGLSSLIQAWFMVFRVDAVQVRTGCCQGIISNGGDRGNVRRVSQGDNTWRYNNDLVIPGAPGDGNDLGTSDGLWDIDDVVSLTPTNDVFQRYFMTRGSGIGSPGAVYTNLRIGGDGVGGGRMISGALAELIGYDVVPTGDEVAQNKAYFDQKWGL